VIGGTSAETNLKTVKLASVKYYDNLPTAGNEGGQAFRDVELEKQVLLEAQKIGLGAQFGGKYFAHDIRIVRLPRHGASCPVGLGVSCSADRNIKCKIDREGIWIEKLEDNPAKYIPEALRHAGEGNAVKIDLNQPITAVLEELSKYPVSTRLSLSGTIIVGRDIAHAKLKERLDKGEGLPQYIKDHPIYYAGPAKTPQGMPSGSFGPTTAGRMDSYVDLFQQHGGSMIMIAKGNRSEQVTAACKKYGGFYLGSIGGPAAILAQNNIKKVECLEYPELGMEAIWKIEVMDFPAFILVDDKGNDFFRQLTAK
jgi:fumarate hydratase class I